jgi:hypothetical protein
MTPIHEQMLEERREPSVISVAADQPRRDGINENLWIAIQLLMQGSHHRGDFNRLPRRGWSIGVN